MLNPFQAATRIEGKIWSLPDHPELCKTCQTFWQHCKTQSWSKNYQASCLCPWRWLHSTHPGNSFAYWFREWMVAVCSALSPANLKRLTPENLRTEERLRPGLNIATPLLTILVTWLRWKPSGRQQLMLKVKPTCHPQTTSAAVSSDLPTCWRHVPLKVPLTVRNRCCAEAFTKAPKHTNTFSF